MSINMPHISSPICPLPLRHDEQIVLGHGSGGLMSHELIREIFQSRFSCPPLNAGNDFASVDLPKTADISGHIVVSTDCHIVTPIFFPGGDIGKLAVCGTVNDVSMSGAVPLYLTAGFILEEGLPTEVLEQIVDSMANAATEAGIQIVAGDTKVAENGKMDKIFINTTGIGWLPSGFNIAGQNAQPGDAVLISGTLGDHGIAVVTARGDLGLQNEVKSDVAPLNHLIQDILKVAPNVHVLRDPTRGGLATTLNEIAQQSNVGILLDEQSIPVDPAVRATCDMLGFDPLYLANEGKVIVIVPKDESEAALSAMKNTPYGKAACCIGYVQNEAPKRVLLRTVIGGTRIIDMLAGEILPRIC